MDSAATPSTRGSTDPTLDAPSPILLSRPSIAEACRMHLVEGSGTALSSEMQSLLQSRLRVAALVLFSGFGAFLLWRFIPEGLGTQTLAAEPLAHIILTALLGLSSLSLCRTCEVSTPQLRLKELLVFGLPACFFLLVQYNRMTACASQHGYIPNTTSTWLMLIFTYAMFIPNNWRRAAFSIGILALLPVALTFYLWATDTACAAVFAKDGDVAIASSLTMVVSGIASVFAVYTMNALRSAAYEARQLGQYHLRQLIGSGGMGEVYLAEHQLMKRPCAIKLIRPEKAGDPNALARFEREVRAIARLSHWNSVDIFDYGRAVDGTFYYVMEYLPGMSLNQLVRRFGPLPAERVVYLLRQTCDALEEAHTLGLIHRDIKPANIFAALRGGRYDVAKLLDFGLAKPQLDPQSPQLTQEGSITGSPLYMSPEQAIGDREPDARSDIYSLGAVAYFLLAGRPPFESDKPLKVLIAHVHDSPVPLSEICPGVPEDLERVVLRCLAKDPDERFSDVRELAAALDACESSGRWTAEDAQRWWNQHQTSAEPAAAMA